jgi:peptidoglycan/LPS O-acetylase OafA/YrhL
MGATLLHPRNFAALMGYLLMCWTWWPALADGHPVGYFFVSWSVATETFFYVCYALFLYRIAGIRSVRACLITLAVFCVLAYVVFFALFMTRDIWEPAVLQRHPDFLARDVDFEFSFYRWLLYFSPYCRLPEFHRRRADLPALSADPAPA